MIDSRKSMDRIFGNPFAHPVSIENLVVRITSIHELVKIIEDRIPGSSFFSARYQGAPHLPVHV